MELPQLIHDLAARPGPVLTWYGESRTELGGGVAARWLAKTANLLAGDLAGDLFEDAEEPGVGGGFPGTGGGEGAPEGPAPTGTIRVDLGRGWQSVTWLAASWLSGWRSVGTGVSGIDEGGATAVDGDLATGTVSAPVSGSDGSGLDVWVSDRIGAEHLAAVAEGCWVLAQAVTPLALSWPTPLPDGVLDALAELSAQSDALEIAPVVPTDLVVADRGAAGGPGGPVRIRDLGRGLRGTSAEAVDPGPSRVLVMSTNPIDDARAVVSHWAEGRSVVMVDPGVHGGEDRARIARLEKVGGSSAPDRRGTPL